MKWKMVDPSGFEATSTTATGAAGGDLVGTYPNPTVKASVALTGTPTLSNVDFAAAAVMKTNSVAVGTGKVLRSGDASGTLYPTYDSGAEGLQRSVTGLYSTTIDIHRANSTKALTDGELLIFPIYVSEAPTLTGVKWMQSVAGSYTGDNNSKVGLYSTDGTNITLVASCADDTALWKATAFTTALKAFSSGYAITPGIYYVAVLYNQSAQTTAPVLYASAVVPNAGIYSFAQTSSHIQGGSLAAQTDLPAGPTALSGFTALTQTILLGLY